MSLQVFIGFTADGEIIGRDMTDAEMSIFLDAQEDAENQARWAECPAEEPD